VGNTKSTRPTWRLGSVYRASEHFDVYGQYATSFKPNTTLQPDGTELKPEIGGQWEIGQRVYFLGSHMYANAAAFRIDRRNVALALPGGWWDQAGQILSKGFETEINGGWSSWSFNVGYGYTDAKYVDYVTTNTTSGLQTVLSGKTRPRVPANTFSYQAAHTWQKGVTVSVSGRTLGDQYLTDANTSYFESYSLFNVAALYRYKQLSFTLSLNNLMDTEYLASTRGNSLWYPGEGRRVMGTVRVGLR
jgi:outer membrane receptor protein involved in Fe transport